MNIQQQAPTTVDGRDSVSVDMENIPLVTKVSYMPGGRFGFLNHQKYHYQYGHVAEH